MSQDAMIGLVISLAILAGFSWLHIANRRRRNSMTRVERAAEDKAHDSDQLW